jgi:hypothetical protein
MRSPQLCSPAHSSTAEYHLPAARPVLQTSHSSGRRKPRQSKVLDTLGTRNDSEPTARTQSTDNEIAVMLEPTSGLEPLTCRLRIGCSTS